MQNSHERELVTQARTNPQAFAALYERYVDRIYAYAYRQVQDGAAAQDITAVTFEKALRSLRRTPWRGDSFVAWLYAIARNEAMTHHRKRRRWLPWQSASSQNGHAPQQRETEAAVFRTEQNAQLHDALGQLPDSDREIIALRYFESLSGEEVAEVLDCTPNAAYVRLHRALKKLEKRLALPVNEGATSHV